MKNKFLFGIFIVVMSISLISFVAAYNVEITSANDCMQGGIISIVTKSTDGGQPAKGDELHLDIVDSSGHKMTGEGYEAAIDGTTGIRDWSVGTSGWPVGTYTIQVHSIMYSGPGSETTKSVQVTVYVAPWWERLWNWCFKSKTSPACKEEMNSAKSEPAK